MNKINQNISRLLSVILISGLGTIVYSNTFNCSFHFDDFRFIADNFAIKSIPLLLAHWKFYPCRFITFLSIAINYHFNGVNVFGYHLFNLAVHLGTTILVWWLVLLTFSTPAMKGNKITPHANLIALFAGLIFVSHPVQTEAVTYIWQRAASMAALFYLASLCLYVKSRLLEGTGGHKVRLTGGHKVRLTGGHKVRPYYVFSLVLAVVAMFTKENTVTLPLMILLYEISFFDTKKNLNWLYLSPFLATLFIIPLTMLFTKAEQFQAIQKFVQGPGGTSPLHYLLTQFRVIVTYIRLSFLPFNQNISYDYPISKSIFELPTMISFLFLTGILIFAKELYSKYRLVSFSIFWFFLTLSLESSLFPLKNIIFEHRLYLPLAGFSIFLVSGVFYLLRKNTIKTMVILLTLIVAFNSILTYQRNKIWKNEITLWGDAAQKSPFKARPYNGLAVAYVLQNDLNDALVQYNKAIDIEPNYAEAYIGRGNIYSRQGKLSQALMDYNQAIKINQNYADAYYNLGILYDKKGNFTQALLAYNKAIEISPHEQEAYYNRGNVWAKQGNLSQALSDYNKAIELDPIDTKAHINRGNIYSRQGHLPQALLDYNKAIAIKPDYVEAYSNRAVVYYILKEYDKAWSDVDQAQALRGKINPDFVDALKNASGKDK